MWDDNLEGLLEWANEMATLQDNLGDRFDFEQNKRGQWNLVPRQMIDNSNQKELATLFEIRNAHLQNQEPIYQALDTEEARLLDKAVEKHLSGTALSALGVRGMRDPKQVSKEERLRAAQYQARQIGTGRDALTGAPISMLNYDAGHIKPNIIYQELANNYKNIRPQAAVVNRAAREAEGSALEQRLLNGWVRRLKRKLIQ